MIIMEIQFVTFDMGQLALLDCDALLSYDNIEMHSTRELYQNLSVYIGSAMYVRSFSHKSSGGQCCKRQSLKGQLL